MYNHAWRKSKPSQMIIIKSSKENNVVETRDFQSKKTLQAHMNIILTPSNIIINTHNEKQDYALVAISKLVKILKKSWI